MKKYAFVGASSRGMEMFAVPMAQHYSDIATIVGIYDPNYKRAEAVKRHTGGSFPVYDSFERMIQEGKPDVVVVATVDSVHHEYIIKALEMGCDAITEKPMTIDESKCQDILDAEKRTGKKVTVTFNARYHPFHARIKELIAEGAVGEILSVNLEWLLDTDHGADYFRRWHRQKENSGGLLIHKSTHHFDFVNWLLEEEPVEVSAFGTRRYYGPTREQRGERCLTCTYKDDCEFYFDLEKDPLYKELYRDCEDIDGYYRDGCVFSDEIDIEDSVSLNVKYSGGAVMSYSLTAHSPYEGFKLSINGSKGRLEAVHLHGNVGPFAGQRVQQLKVFNRKHEEHEIRVPVIAIGGHGGSDERLLSAILKGMLEDPLGQQADSWDGAMSLIVGVAANVSMKEGRLVKIKELVQKP